MCYTNTHTTVHSVPYLKVLGLILRLNTELFHSLSLNPLKTKRVCFIQCVPLATEPGISLIILKPMKIRVL